MPRFIHAADIHLDSPLRKLEAYDGAPVAEIRGATRRALVNLVDLAIEQVVDFVVIAGDVYDGDWRDQQTGLFFNAQANRLIHHGIPLLVIRGNHDAASVITKTLPSPRNPDGSSIMLGTDKAQSIRLEHVGATVHGRSFGTRAERENMAADYPSADLDMFNIGVLHTSLAGAEGHEPYAPCSPAQLAERGYQYWALGHIHQRGEHQVAGAAPIVFSGNTQGRHARETGPKGCVLVEYDRNGVTQMDFHTLDVARWEVCHLNVQGTKDFDEVAERYASWLQEQVDAVGDRLLINRVRLTGATQLHEELVAKREHFEGVLRATGLNIATDQVWLESLRVRTRAEQQKGEYDLDGPVASVVDVFKSLELAGSETLEIQRDLDALNKRLNLVDVAFDVNELLEEAQAGLLAHLRGAGEE